MSYHEQKEPINDNFAINLPPINTYKDDKFEWLDTLLQWNLMWVTRKSSGQFRHYMINIVGMMCTLSTVGVWTYFEYHDDYYGGTIMDWIIDSVELLSMSLGRLFSIYYFAIIFNSKKIISKYSVYSHNRVSYEQNDNDIRKASNRLKLILSLSTTVILFHWSLLYLDTDFRNSFRNAIDPVISFLGFFWPICIYQCSISRLILKYQLYLKHLSQQIDNGTTFFKILAKYRNTLHLFEQEFQRINRYLIVILISFCIQLWEYVGVFVEGLSPESLPTYKTELIYAITGLFCYVLQYVEFVIAGSNMNNSYHLFKDKLWKFDDGKNDFPICQTDRISLMFKKYSNEKPKLNDKNVMINELKVSVDKINQTIMNIKDYHYLLNFVDKHPMTIKFLGVTVSVSNFLKFITVFGITKLVSYAIYYYAHP